MQENHRQNAVRGMQKLRAHFEIACGRRMGGRGLQEMTSIPASRGPRPLSERFSKHFLSLGTLKARDPP